MTLVQHVAHLRTLAVLDPDTTMLEVAIIGALEEVAAAVDHLQGDQGPDDDQQFGSI